nr:hypothetical protein [Tanacetum cinerariifolium]
MIVGRIVSDNDLMNNQRPCNRFHEDEDEESEENPFGDGSLSNEQSVLRPRRWESGMRVNIPDFDGDTLNPEVSLIGLMRLKKYLNSKSGLKCFNYGKPGHRQSKCKKAGKRRLFADPEDDDDDVAYGDYEATLVYDEGSRLKAENHPKPYKLEWLKKGREVTVSKRVYVSFLLGTTYKDNVWCDVVAMDACHLLLGRPWEYDRDITHNGKTNTYSFLFAGIKITLMPKKPKEVVNKPTGTLLTLSQFEDELEIREKMNSNDYRLKLPSHIWCSDVFNVKHLFPYNGNSSDEDNVGNSRTNFVYPGGNDVNLSIEERADLFLEARDRVRKKGLLKWA